MVLLDEIEVTVVIERRRRILLALVLEVRPGVRPCQVDRLAAAVGEVTRILGMNSERPACSSGRLIVRLFSDGRRAQQRRRQDGQSNG